MNIPLTFHWSTNFGWCLPVEVCQWFVGDSWKISTFVDCQPGTTSPSTRGFWQLRRRKTESKSTKKRKLYSASFYQKRWFNFLLNQQTFMTWPASGLNSGFMCISSFKYSRTSDGIEPNLLLVILRNFFC